MGEARQSAEDQRFMRRAIALAREGWGRTHPNPLVGACIVENGELVSEGWHAKAGGPHAERAALKALGRKPAADATLYVTLEPCSTHGRTRPCTEAILSAGLRRVVIGATDPNPAHAGRALDILRAADIDVTSGVLATECADLNLIFNHWITTGRPLITAKVATTLDGCIATRTNDSKWITGEVARVDVHRWRRYFPAIAVGSGTVINDNPALTARLPEETFCPVRFVFDRSARIPQAIARGRQFHLTSDSFTDRTILLIGESAASDDCVHSLTTSGINYWCLSDGSDAAFLEAFIERCIRETITGVLVEGGSGLLSSFLAHQKLDYLFNYRAPKLLADAGALPAFTGGNVEFISEAVTLTSVMHAAFGDDQLMRGQLRYPE